MVCIPGKSGGSALRPLHFPRKMRTWVGACGGCTNPTQRLHLSGAARHSFAGHRTDPQALPRFAPRSFSSET
eukprot:4111733-Amphidinium_carterae.1